MKDGDGVRLSTALRADDPVEPIWQTEQHVLITRSPQAGILSIDLPVADPYEGGR